MFNIIKADDRLKKSSKVNILLAGPSGIGKTTLARTLDPERTLFIDLEAGTLALQNSGLRIINVRKDAEELGIHPWVLTKLLGLIIGGPDPSDDEGFYSRSNHAKLVEQSKEALNPDDFDTVFIDSLTVASRECFKWAQYQDEAKTDKGKPNKLGQYGLLGNEMVTWATHLQHSPKSVIMACILESKPDKFQNMQHELQIEGGKAGRELPGIFDEVLSLVNLADPEGALHRRLVCHQQNSWGYPAKDRSGCLEMVEEANLSEVMEKIRAGKRLDFQS